MYIIIIGGGKVGHYLAKELVDGGYEALVIEKQASKCAELVEEIGDFVMRGDGCEVMTLEQAGMGRADMVVAVTGDDEDNLVACQVARHKFGVERTIARINNPKNEIIFRKLGIVTTVSATTAILAHIEQELPSHPIIPLMTIKGGGLEIVEVKIPRRAPVDGMALKNVLLPQQSLISLIIGEDGVPRVPTADTILHAGDEVVAVALKESEDALRAVLAGEQGDRQ